MLCLQQTGLYSGTSLPSVQGLEPVWHYKCLKALPLGRFSWSTLALSNRNSKESQPLWVASSWTFPWFCCSPKSQSNQDGPWHNSQTKWVVLLGNKEAWTWSCPVRKGIKGTDYWATSTRLVQTLCACPHACWAVQQSSLCIYSGTHFVWGGAQNKQGASASASVRGAEK